MSQVIKKICAKSEEGFSSPIYLGAEQRFIDALRGTNIHNLEEQYIIGVDCITTEYWQISDKGEEHIIEKMFSDGAQSNSKYYKLVITEYLDNINSSTADEKVIRVEQLYYNSLLVVTKEVKQKQDGNKKIIIEKIIR